MDELTKHDYSAYTHGCRCDVCRAANTERKRIVRNRHRRVRLFVESVATGRNFVDGIKHGYAGYTEMSCRCQVCTAAKSRADSRRG